MTPAILSDLAAAETQIRTAAATLDLARPADSACFAQLLDAAARLCLAREALEDMARGPVPAEMRALPRIPPRLRVIEGGAA